MVTYRELVGAFRRLGLEANSKVVAHASLSAFGEVVGGAETVVGALVGSFESVVMPTFTLRTMVTPQTGPADNAMAYGIDPERNAVAEIFRPDLPADRSMGVVAETLRLHPEANRSLHPIVSFAGVDAEAFLETQLIEEPWEPLARLAEADADVLLLGVDQRANVSLHYAEALAGRKGYLRWALTPGGVVECPGWPGCSDGFNSIGHRLSGIRRRAEVGAAVIEAVPLRDLLHLTTGWLREDPLALLCDRPNCPRCSLVRASVRVRK
ncbi:MAG TPA: AAC(3) family N-acetyltransferase [Anaerolineales bacterium]